MRAFLTAVLLGIGTLCAAAPADASWLSEAFRNSNASVYIGPQPVYGYAQPFGYAQPYGYVQPSYYPQAFVPAPYAPVPYIVQPALVPRASFYPTQPRYYPSHRAYGHQHYHR